MLEISTIRFEKERVLEGLNKRFLPETQIGLIETILSLDDERKKSQTEGDIVLSEINKLSKEIGDLFKTGKQSEANDLKDQVALLKEKSKVIEENNKRIQQELGDMIIQLPNVPHVSVPVGKHAEDNEVYRDWSGDLDTLPSDALPHWEIAE
nr:serine--tRNA ligase [Saprospiraceae bacterium]